MNKFDFLFLIPKRGISWLCCLFIILSPTLVQAQTVTGTVFFDGNRDGIKNATEVGYGGVTIKAYASSATPVATAISSLTGGGYTLTGLTAGTSYRIEFTMNGLPVNSGVSGAENKSSVQFAATGATGINFGVYFPNEVATERNPRMVAGCGLIWLTDRPSTTSVASWRYLTRATSIAIGATDPPHQDDILATQVGIPWGMDTRREGTNQYVFMSPVASKLTGVFPTAPNGDDAIYVADYSNSSTGYAFQSYKLLVDLGALAAPISLAVQNPVSTAASAQFGEYGLGGIAITEDGKTLYAANMGSGKLIKMDISGVVYASLPATAPTTATEITITGAGCSTGFFRPTSLKVYNGELYIGGVCDGSAGATDAGLRVKILKMNLATNAFTEVFSYDPTLFTAGNLQAASINWPQVRWKSTFVGDPAGAGELQPVVSDFAFDDSGSLIIGIANRKVFSSASNSDMGYLVRTWRNADGTFTLENTGVSGPYTTTARESSTADGTPGNKSQNAGGPGGTWFYEQGVLAFNEYHPYLFNGGVFVLPGSGEVMAGFTDPYYTQQIGARYFNATNGRVTHAISFAGQKQFSLTGTRSVGAENPIEIGNRVWKDTNNDGIQDPGEPPLAGVTVAICARGSSTPIGTALTDATGNYYFSTEIGTSTASKILNLTLTPNTDYDLKITALGSDTSVTGLGLTDVSLLTPGESGTVNSGTTLANNDAKVVSGKPTIVIRTGSYGDNNHNYDFGFKVAPPCALTVTATPGLCQTATNQYTVSGNISLTNAVAGTATVTDGARSTTVSIPANATSVAYSLTGLTSGSGSHTVTVTLASCGTASTTYAAPVSCTVAPPCSVSLALTKGACNSATNTYSATATVSATNIQPPRSMTLNVAGVSQVFNLTASGINTVVYTANGLVADGAVKTVSASFAGTTCQTTNTTFTAPVSCSVAPVCSLTVTPTAGVCQTATNTYSATVVVRIANTNAGGVLTLTDAGSSQTIAVGANLNSFTGTAIFNGLSSNGSSHLVSASLASCSSQTATYTAPAPCTVCSISLTTSTLPNGQVGTAYSQTLTTTGGTAPLVFTISAGSLPAGLVLNAATGVISGTPTASGTASFTIKVTDAKNCSAIAPLTITTLCPSFTVAVTSATICTGQTANLTASGASTYVWSTGATTASISVSVAGVYSVTGTSAAGCWALATGTLTVNPAVTATISGNLSICVGRSTTLTASGGATYRWSTGVTTATISVSTAGTYSVTATSSAGCSNTATVTVIQNPNPTVIVTSATICRGQTATLTASGAATYLWSQGGNTASIQVSATATTAYSVTGSTSAGCSATATGSVTVNGQPQINNITQSTACVGNTASLTVNATNTGAGTLEYSLNGGAFQTANSFTLNAPSSVTATVVVRNQGSSCSATASVVVNCACATPVSLTFVPTTLQTCAGSPVSFTVGVSGATSASLTTTGTGTFSQSVISGLTTINYQPSVADANAGSVTLTLTSADPDGAGACVAAQLTRTLLINPAPSVSATSASVCAGTTGTLTAAGASTYRWNMGGAGLPATTASISVSVAGVYSVTGTSAAGCWATASGTLTVYSALSISPSSLPDGTAGVAYSQTITASGGSPAYVFSNLGSLPVGLAVNGSTGVISGTPTAPAGTASFTVLVTDSKSCSAVVPLTITTSSLPVCSLTATATPGVCNSATNTYSVTGTVSATNAGTNSPQTLTISVGGVSTTVTLTGNGPVSYTLSGLVSDGLTKTVSVVSSASGCGSTSGTYTAPASCTVAPCPPTKCIPISVMRLIVR